MFFQGCKNKKRRNWLSERACAWKETRMCPFICARRVHVRHGGQKNLGDSLTSQPAFVRHPPLKLLPLLFAFPEPALCLSCHPRYFFHCGFMPAAVLRGRGSGSFPHGIKEGNWFYFLLLGFRLVAECLVPILLSSMVSNVCSHMVTTAAFSLGTPREISSRCAVSCLQQNVVPMTAFCIASEPKQTSEGSDVAPLVLCGLLSW